MEKEKKILLVSPNKNLIKSFYNNTIEKLNLPTNLKFVQLNFDYPEDAAIKNIYRILLNLKSFKTYKSVIIIYPIDDIKFKYSSEEYTALNDLLCSAGLKNGISICTTALDGKLNNTMQLNIKNYLNQISRN